MKYIIAISLTLIAVFLALAVFLPKPSQPQDPQQSLSAVANYYDTTASGFVEATTTVNTTATRLFATVSKICYVINNTTSTLTCSRDAANTTAASSSVASGRGLIIGPNTGTIIPASASFGECGPGDKNCYRHKGALNCLADTAKTITTSCQ